MSPGQDAIENAKDCPSDLDTRVQECEAMPSLVSKYGIVAVLLHLGTHERSGAALASFADWHEQPVRVTK